MTHVLIMAAGKGTRMKTELPKVLNLVKGKPIIEHLLQTVTKVCERPTLVVGHKAAEVIAATGNKYHYVEQKEQLGTGHALMSAASELKDKDMDALVVLMGDHPLVSLETINNLFELQKKTGAAITMATVAVPNYEGDNSIFQHYGRVIRGEDGTVDRIIEFKDATEEERACTEVNLNYLCYDPQWLWKNIGKLTNDNAAKEYYVTDLVKIARDDGKIVAAFPLKNSKESYGINTPEQLKMVEDAIS